MIARCSLFTGVAYPRLQAAASPEMVAAAVAECDRLESCNYSVSVASSKLLISACTAALSNLKVSKALCAVMETVCGGVVFNATSRLPGTDPSFKACVAAGAIPAVIAALSAHGEVSELVATRGCSALGALVAQSKPNADVIILDNGGLDVLLSVMAAHAVEAEVQKCACYALGRLAAYAGRTALTVLLDGRVTEVLTATKRFGKDSHVQRALHRLADEALETLARRQVRV